MFEAYQIGRLPWQVCKRHGNCWEEQTKVENYFKQKCHFNKKKMFAPRPTFKKVACLTRKKKNRGLQPTKKINRKKATPKMLIFQAIVEAPNQQLNLCDIYAWFQANFLHFRSSNLTWKVKIKNTSHDTSHTNRQTDRQMISKSLSHSLKVKNFLFKFLFKVFCFLSFFSF